MEYTLKFRPRTRIAGATEGEAKFQTASEALREAVALERSDELVRIFDASGHEISKSYLEIMIHRDSK